MMAPAPRFFCAYLYAFRTPFQQVFDKSICPPIDHARKALKYQGFFAPKALHTSPMSAHSVTGLFSFFLPGAIRAVFRPVGFWHKVAAADGAGLHAVAVEQGGAQGSVQRQDGGTKPFADQRVSDALRTNTFFAIVKKQTAPAIIIATAMYQPPGCAVLLIVHVRNHGLSSVMGNLT